MVLENMADDPKKKEETLEDLREQDVVQGRNSGRCVGIISTMLPSFPF